MSIEEVPHFAEHEPEKEWLDNLEVWLGNLGYVLRFDCSPPEEEFYMVWGTSPRGLYHSVIHLEGKLIHDPHPDGGDVVPKNYVWIEKGC
jgi:hypothetical protein